MPMDRTRYPKNWIAIAHCVKEAAKWTCQECGRPCRKPNEAIADLEGRLYKMFADTGSGWWDELWHTQDDGSEVMKPQRFTLTVAHLDHNPSNCEAYNLKALCSGCHLRYDAPLHARNASATRMRKREQRGQLSLLGATEAIAGGAQ